MGADEARVPRPPVSIRGRLVDGPFSIRVGRRRAREGDAGPVRLVIDLVVEEGVLVLFIIAERVDGGRGGIPSSAS